MFHLILKLKWILNNHDKEQFEESINKDQNIHEKVPLCDENVQENSQFVTDQNIEENLQCEQGTDTFEEPMTESENVHEKTSSCSSDPKVHESLQGMSSQNIEEHLPCEQSKETCQEPTNEDQKFLHLKVSKCQNNS